jgi:hypothetical protein
MTETNQVKYELLIDEFVQQRDAIKLMIEDLEKVKIKIDTLLPDSIDKRFVRLFEEKVKAMTELFRVILDMRKEIIKNAKDEIELRKKFLVSDDDDDFDINIFNIKKIAERVEKLSRDKRMIEQNVTILPTEITNEEKENK